MNADEIFLNLNLLFLKMTSEEEDNNKEQEFFVLNGIKFKRIENIIRINNKAQTRNKIIKLIRELEDELFFQIEEIEDKNPISKFHISLN